MTRGAWLCRVGTFCRLPLVWPAYLGLLCLPAGGCGRSPSAAATAAAAIRLTDVTEAAGITFRHTNGASGRLYFPETMGSGCAFLDYDGDGRPDIFLVNSTALPGFKEKGPFYPALYRNRGDGTFEEVTEAAGLQFEGYGMGVAVGDFDNDGDEDLYVTAMGANRLFRNERVPTGEARFTDVTEPAGVGDHRFGTSAVWFDYDRDGHLDLFIANYCHWEPSLHRVCRTGYGEHTCGPKYYPGSRSTLYRNNGDGTFADVTEAVGMGRARGKALGVAIFDPDDDGWPDLFVAHDGEPNSLYLNRGVRHADDPERRFEDAAVARGVAFSMDGKARAGMGIDTALLPGDAHESVVIGHNPDEGLGLFRPVGGGLFIDQAYEAGLFEPSLSFLTFGLLFRDIDSDGIPDLLVANGHVDARVEIGGGQGTFEQRLLLFRGLGPDAAGLPRFAEIAQQAGPALATRRVWRGLAAADVDSDGDCDFLVSACNGAPMLLRNETTPRRRWLQVALEGVRSNRQGIGSRVLVEAGGRKQVGWVRSGSSYLSSSELVAHFGLGEAEQVERVVVRWASGGEEEVRGVAVDRRIVIREGHGIVSNEAAVARPGTEGVTPTGIEGGFRIAVARLPALTPAVPALLGAAGRTRARQ